MHTCSKVPLSFNDGQQLLCHPLYVLSRVSDKNVVSAVSCRSLLRALVTESFVQEETNVPSESEENGDDDKQKQKNRDDADYGEGCVFIKQTGLLKKAKTVLSRDLVIFCLISNSPLFSFLRMPVCSCTPDRYQFACIPHPSYFLCYVLLLLIFTREEKSD